eukprot:3461261-Prymnesium_polylepis.2
MIASAVTKTAAPPPLLTHVLANKSHDLDADSAASSTHFRAITAGPDSPTGDGTPLAVLLDGGGGGGGGEQGGGTPPPSLAEMLERCR